MTDLTFLSLDGIVGLVRNGRKGVKVLEEAGHTDEASHLSQQTEKAYKAIEESTGVDVRKMSEVEFDEFVENNPILKETKQKVERTRAFKEHGGKF